MKASALALQPQREVWGQTLVELIDENPNIIVLDGDLANSTRAELVALRHPHRFLEMGIAEQNMMGVAAGLATLGFIPWLSSFACFLSQRSLDQLRVSVAQPGLNVKLAAHYAGILTASTGKTHQVVEDLALMRAMPGMTVICPADGVEVKQAVRAATDCDGPVYMRLLRDAETGIFDEASYTFQLGKGVVLREGKEVAVISTGAQTPRTYQAVESLAAEGVDCYLLHLPTLKPLDGEAIIEAAASTGFVVTVEEHNIYGGLGGAVAEVLSEHLPTRLRRIGLQDTYAESGPNHALLEKYGLSTDRVAAAIKGFLFTP